MKELAIRPIEPSADLVDLLSTCALPVGDIGLRKSLKLYGGFQDEELVASVGIELTESFALLRSLAIRPPYRSIGLGRTLIEYAEQQAHSFGVEALFLLTTTAASYFERHGYAPVERHAVPHAVRQTAQFASLCPDVAIVMRKTVVHDFTS